DRGRRSYAIPGLVESRREADDRHLAGHDGDDAAADAGLRRQPGVVGPRARLVVEPGHHHDREELRHVLLVDDALVRDGVHAAVRERRAHARELLRGDADRTLLRVDVDALERVGVDAVVLRENEADAAV